MRNTLAVYSREMRSYFSSPVFFILSAVFVLVLGNMFKDAYFDFASRTMQIMREVINYRRTIPHINVNLVANQMFTYMDFLFILIVPLLTMRLYAEEKKNGTMELLMTSPITTTQVMLGKFLSCLTIYAILMGLTLLFNILLMIQSGFQLDWGPVFSSYIGTLLLGTTLISIGMFFSSLTENQIVAAAVSLTFILGLWLMIFTARFFGPPFNQFFSYLSLSEHLDAFAVGFIHIKHLLYYVSMTTFWMILTGLTVESARWRQ